MMAISVSIEENLSQSNSSCFLNHLDRLGISFGCARATGPPANFFTISTSSSKPKSLMNPLNAITNLGSMQYLIIAFGFGFITAGYVMKLFILYLSTSCKGTKCLRLLQVNSNKVHYATYLY